MSSTRRRAKKQLFVSYFSRSNKNTPTKESFISEILCLSLSEVGDNDDDARQLATTKKRTKKNTEDDDDGEYE